MVDSMLCCPQAHFSIKYACRLLQPQLSHGCHESVANHLSRSGSSSGQAKGWTCGFLQFGNGYAAFCLLNGEESLRSEVNAADSFSDLRCRYVKEMKGEHGRFDVLLPAGTLLDKICMQTLSASVEPWLPRKRGKPSE